jgi:formimidoylglutamate deiminase
VSTRPELGRSKWLVREGCLDARWQLVHATHATVQEIAAVAASGAGIVLCPSTEANLGDGLPDLPSWLAAGVPITIGSDSQATRAWCEELRLLEYGQRLVRSRSQPSRPRPSSVSRRPPSACSGASATDRPGAIGRALVGPGGQARAPMRWPSVPATMRSSASRRHARSMRSSSAARRRRGAT